MCFYSLTFTMQMYFYCIISNSKCEVHCQRSLSLKMPDGQSCIQPVAFCSHSSTACVLKGKSTCLIMCCMLGRDVAPIKWQFAWFEPSQQKKKTKQNATIPNKLDLWCACQLLPGANLPATCSRHRAHMAGHSWLLLQTHTVAILFPLTPLPVWWRLLEM